MFAWRSGNTRVKGATGERSSTPCAELPALWQSLDEREKKRFLRHVAHFWDVHRHRVAPQVYETIERARREGRFALIAGRIRALSSAGMDGMNVLISQRGTSRCDTLRVRRVINCTGPSRGLQAGFPSSPIFVTAQLSYFTPNRGRVWTQYSLDFQRL